jgi:hypothetical protein
MNKPELIRRIVEYRFPGWLAAILVFGLILAIKFMAG